MLLYYITDRKQFPGTETERRTALLRRIGEAASLGVDLIQLREKDLPTGDLEKLARDAVRAVRNHSQTTGILINSRTDVALAVGADGVHLTVSDISASEARAIAGASFRHPSPLPSDFVIGVSCHSVAKVRAAESHGANFVVLAPIFEKPGTDVPALGFEVLRSAARTPAPDNRVEAGDNRGGIPVLALGGVTLENAADCRKAGAAGVAGIRLFQTADLRELIRRLKSY